MDGRPVRGSTLVAAVTVLACLGACRATPSVPGPAPTEGAIAVPTTPAPQPLPSTAEAPPPPASPSPEPFAAHVEHVDAADLGDSWHPGCPVDPEDLRMLTVSFWGFDGHAHAGRLVANAAATEDLISVFRTLYEHRWPVRRMVPVAAYGGDDDRSMAADNTSAFNCRAVPGTSTWSEHAYGWAVDLNPRENPYVNGSEVLPPAGARYADRTLDAPGMIHEGDLVWRAFHGIGWPWGGGWRSLKDYQHFSSTGL